MSHTIRKLGAVVLSILIALCGFGMLGAIPANAEVDATKLVLKVTNQYGQPVEGAEFYLDGGGGESSYYTVGTSNAEGIIEKDLPSSDSQDLLDQLDYNLKLKSDTLTYDGDATVSFEIGDEKFTVYEVSGEDYTGKIDVTVNDPNAADPSVSPYRTATDADVKAAMNGTADNTVLVDARSTDSYQGWALGDAKRGGHLKNAVSYPATAVTNPVTPNKNEGTTVSDYQAQTIQDAGLTTNKEVIIYDTNDTDAKTVADALVKDHGFSADNITTYNATKLINSGKAKVVKYKNYDLYVPAEVVNNIAQNKVGKLDEYSDNAAKVVNGDDVVILDVGWGDETSDKDTGSGYDAGHVPGAIHVNTDEYETPKVYVPSKPE